MSMGSQIDTEMEILRSRTLAEDVVDSLALQFRLVAPNRIARADLLEAINVARETPPGRYRLEQRAGTHYILQDRHTGTVLGDVSQGAPVTFRGVSFTLRPQPYQVLDFDIVRFDEAVKQLQDRLEVKRPNLDASIVTVGYKGGDPRIAADVPNILAAKLIAQRRDVRQTETRSAARFLRDQIDKVSQS
jgi:uncharacterized protein involved in exopolysaccharide biosynthesis